MSADAKAWNDGDWWTGIHDGDCLPSAEHCRLNLREVLESIEQCMGVTHMRWHIRNYPNDQTGLVGYIS